MFRVFVRPHLGEAANEGTHAVKQLWADRGFGAYPQCVKKLGIIHKPRLGQVAAAGEKNGFFSTDYDPYLRVKTVSGGSARNLIVLRRTLECRSLRQRSLISNRITDDQTRDE